MAAVYDNWERLVRATIRREDLRLSGMRTPSDLSLASSSPFLSPSSSFNFNISSPSTQLSSSSFSNLSLPGDSFTYHQILQVTNYLSSSNLIMYGGSGDIFYGVLERGIQVAVKKVDLSSSDKSSFLTTELEFYAKVSHPKFVPLLGHCLEYQNHKFLVYKYMPNLDLLCCLKFGIIDGGVKKSLDWEKRLKIANGVAYGLYHLHHQCVPPLVHRISERGSSGASNATCAYDVYCFGKVLLQLVTGNLGFSDYNDSRKKDLMEITLPYITTDDKELFMNILDPRLTMDEHLLIEVWAVAFVAKACLNPEPSKRPQMTNVLEALQEFKSLRFSTYGSPQSIDATSSDINAAFWNSQFSSASGSEKTYPNWEVWGHP